MKSILPLILLLVSPLFSLAVEIDTVLIGDPNNNPDLQKGLFGRVSTTYEIGVTEISNAQYAEFLNAVAASDPYSLYHANMGFNSKGGILQEGSSGSFTYAVKPEVVVNEEGQPSYTYTYGDKPVVWVSFYDALRFTNWLHNGQGSGSTETGAYTLLGGTPTPTNGDSITRNPGAQWFLPTEDEWYKAAYYDVGAGIYHDYPTGTDAVPNNNRPEEDSGNSANFFQDDPLTDIDNTTGSLDYPYTSVGAYTLSPSPNGTFDQGGNVWEWNQTLIGAGSRGRRGGAWNSESASLNAADQNSLIATFQTDSLGFRVARVVMSDGLAGDFNNDGAVDAADYVVWRKNNGSQAEYDDWVMNFGTSSGGAGSGSIAPAAVPEPSCLLAVLAGSVLCYVRGRRPTRSLHVK